MYTAIYFMTRLLTLNIALIVMLYVSPVFGADIYGVNSSCYYLNKKCDAKKFSIVIEGDLNVGDAEKFNQILSESEYTNNVIVRSRGGSLADALKIGKLIRSLYLATEAPEIISGDERHADSGYCLETKIFSEKKEQCVCASACFLIYAAGMPRNNAYVLLHRPYIRPDANAKLDIEDSVKSASEMKEKTERYLQQMGIPQTYADVMFSTPSNNARFIPYKQMRDEIFGYSREVEEWLMAKCNVLSIGQRQEKMDSILDKDYAEENPYFEILERHPGDIKLISKVNEWYELHQKKIKDDNDRLLKEDEKARDCEYDVLMDKRYNLLREWKRNYQDKMHN